ncbi:hypothetical protein [Gloeobacter violaceus]|uniref:Glr4364 protein n=1 Tax=Gloeobacter violaceus (strain ATCC 29082 / PCC 7421) TaxID=251221 RepID=Q7ND72_GLOVI|nr:hypothetical protein [Gloeobacter violaceus]BAC92305.1 glr4364 [Gloeobacter violaceus PCC 7421]
MAFTTFPSPLFDRPLAEVPAVVLPLWGRLRAYFGLAVTYLTQLLVVENVCLAGSGGLESPQRSDIEDVQVLIVKTQEACARFVVGFGRTVGRGILQLCRCAAGTDESRGFGGGQPGQLSDPHPPLVAHQVPRVSLVGQLLRWVLDPPEPGRR